MQIYYHQGKKKVIIEVARIFACKNCGGGGLELEPHQKLK